MMKLRIGEIHFTNLFPIFFALRKGSDCSDYEFVQGVPAELNHKIRLGAIDISPSSSIEYLRDPDKYVLIENHSISSKGPVGSIILFSRLPLPELAGRTVFTSSQSETSVALLHIVLKKFYGAECILKSSSESIESVMAGAAAYLLIGDDALIQSDKWPGLYRYDLGGIWHEHTGLPFTFALWIMRKDCCDRKKRLVDRFVSDLEGSKKYALSNLEAIARESPMNRGMSAEKLVSYWRGISYDFGEEHRKGFELFSRYCRELGLLQT